MLSNYLKLAWRILGRRKFFTFISLFGISFTLGILMTALSFMQSELGSNSPLSKKDDFVFLSHLRLASTYYDTLTLIDTIHKSGIEVYDTTYEYKDKGTGMSQSSLSKGIIDENFLNIPSAVDVTMFNASNTNDVYVNGVKLSLNILLTDDRYVDVFDHEVLEGRFFDAAEVEGGSLVIVISTETAQDYFGRMENVIGEEMFIDGKTLKVIGMYKHNGKIPPFVSPDAISSYTAMSKTTSYANYYFGPYMLMFVSKPNAADRLKEEIIEVGNRIPTDHPDNRNNFNDVVFKPKTYNEMYAQSIYYEDDAEKSLSIMKIALLSLLVFFTVLPTLNLININVSRIMDRSSEIGVRKAFGAHQGNIIGQFIVENIVQTILGGIIGLCIAIGLISIINNGGYLGKTVLSFNTKFFVYSFIVTLFFGVLSGLVPAFKMSKLQIVDALKENKL